MREERSQSEVSIRGIPIQKPSKSSTHLQEQSSILGKRQAELLEICEAFVDSPELVQPRLQRPVDQTIQLQPFTIADRHTGDY